MLTVDSDNQAEAGVSNRLTEKKDISWYRDLTPPSERGHHATKEKTIWGTGWIFAQEKSLATCSFGSLIDTAAAQFAHDRPISPVETNFLPLIPARWPIWPAVFLSRRFWVGIQWRADNLLFDLQT